MKAIGRLTRMTLKWDWEKQDKYLATLTPKSSKKYSHINLEEVIPLHLFKDTKTKPNKKYVKPLKFDKSVKSIFR